MIKVTIREAAEAREIENAYQFSKKVGFAPMVGSRIWNNEVQPDLNSLDKICKALKCDLSELIRYVPNGTKRKKR